MYVCMYVCMYVLYLCSMTVRERYRTHPNEILPPPHRLAVAQMLVQNSKWLSVVSVCMYVQYVCTRH